MNSELKRKREDDLEFTLTIKSHNLDEIISLFRQDQSNYTSEPVETHGTETAKSLMEGMSEKEKKEILEPVPEPVSDVSLEQLQKAAREASKRMGSRTPIGEMLTRQFNVQKLTEIPVSRYKEALDTLEAMKNA